MARRRDVEAAIRAVELADDEWAQRFERTKVRVYLATLRSLADQFTSSGAGPAGLSEQIRSTIHAEARAHARSVARTHNRAVRKQALRISSAGDGRTRADLERELRDYSRSRLRDRSEAIAVTESYGAHADAIASFFRDAGVEPEFSFGGHPDDAEPVCEICKAIIAANPHSLADVIRIGVPHPFCRQSWHPLIGQGALPDTVDSGRTPGGIVGEPMLIQRAGSERDAAESVVQSRG